MLVKSLNEKNKRIKELEELLNIEKDYSDFDFINSSILKRSPNEFYNYLTIDKGYKNGIEKNMAVISNNGLIGRIINTTKNTSTVKLLTSNSSGISVLIKSGDKNIYGILTEYKNGYFIIKGIADNNEIEKYASITTTGLDNIFPSGILVGYVDKTKKDNFDLEKTVYTISSTNFDDINYVAVLKRKE